MSSFVIRRYRMRAIIYIIAILNVVMGFIMLFRENSPFKGKTFRDIAKKRGKEPEN